MGLDKPQQEVTVLKTDGTTFTLYIGNQNSSNNDFYVKVDDGADVYTMPSSSVNAFNMQPMMWQKQIPSRPLSPPISVTLRWKKRTAP